MRRNMLIHILRSGNKVLTLNNIFRHNESMQKTVDCIWTDHDTAICERAEASGLAINANTGKPLTLDELRKFAIEYDKIRNQTTVDEFLKAKISSKPFVF